MEIRSKQQKQIMEMIKNPEVKRQVSIIKTQVIRESEMLYGTKRFTSPEEAVDVVRGIFQYADKELMVVMSLDSKNAPLAIEIVAIGTINACLVEMRELFKHAILNNAAAIICFHNHPSGVTLESKQDVQITKRIEEAGRLLGIPLLDHIIIGLDKEYLSLREKGILTINQTNIEKWGNVNDKRTIYR